LYYALKFYTVNNANVGRNNAIMQSQMKPYSDKDLRDMAAYIASLPSDLVVKK
jgi:cytochrome c553